MRIAVCDDDEICLRRVLMLTEAYRQAYPDAQTEIYSFCGAEPLLAELRKERRFDLYLLDILMPETDGIALAEAIRARDEGAMLIFITSSADFSLSAFGLKAVRYLMKPLAQSDYFEALSFASTYFENRDREAFMVKAKDGLIRIGLHEIVVVENVGHVVRVHLREGGCVESVNYRQAFAETVRPLLAYPNFVQPHQSFVINLDYVKGFAGDAFELLPERSVPISRAKSSSMRRAYLDYLSRENLWGGRRQ